MKIRQIDIDAFGSLEKMRLGPLGPGLTVFLGGNEAGKSTTLSFIRAMFFGFPDRRRNQRAYEPLCPGTYGGRLTIESDGGKVVTIERRRRFDGSRSQRSLTRIYSEDGEALPASYLKGLFGSVTKILYENVFGFSLEELQGLESLGGGEIKDAIYGAGFGTSLLAVPLAMKRLNRDLSALFRPAGKRQEINRILDRIEEVKSRLRVARGHIDEYRRLGHVIRDSDRELPIIDSRISRIDRDLGKLKLIRGSWNGYVSICSLDARIKGLRDRLEDNIPSEQELWHAREILKRIKKAETQLDARRQELAGIRSRLEENRFRPDILDKKADIQGLLAKRDHFLSLEQEIARKKQELDDLQTRFSSGIEVLGSGWSRERLHRIDIGFGQRAALNRFERRFQQIEQEKTILKEERKVRRGDLQETVREANGIRNGLEAIENSLIVTDEVQLQDLKDVLSEAEGVARRLSRINEMKGELSRWISSRANGLGLGPEDLLSLDLESFAKEALSLIDDFRDTIKRIEILSIQYSHGSNELRQMEEGLKARVERVSSIEGELGRLKGTILEVSALVKTLSISLPERSRLEYALSSLGLEERSLALKIRQMKKRGVLLNGLVKACWFLYPLCLAGAGSIFFPIFKGIPDEALAIAGILALSITFLVQVYAKRKKGQIELRRQENMEKLEAMRRELAFRKKELSKINENLARLSGLLDEPEDEVVAAFSRVMEQNEHYLSLWKEKRQLEAEIGRISQDIERKRKDVASIRKEIECQEERREGIKRAWNELKKSAGMVKGPEIESLGDISLELLELFSRVDELRDVADEDSRNRRRLKELLNTLCERLGIKKIDESRDRGRLLFEIRQKVGETEKGIRELESQKSRLAGVEARIETCEARIGEIDRCLEETYGKAEHLMDEWSNFLEALGLGQYVEEEALAIDGLFSRIERLKEMSVKMARMVKVIDGLVRETDEAARAVRLLIEAARVDYAFDGLVPAVDFLVKLYEEESEKQASCRVLNTKSRLVVEEMGQLERILEEAEGELAEILDTFNVPSVEGFEKKVEEGLLLSDLEEEFNSELLALSSRFGVRASMESLSPLFSQRSIPELDAEIEVLSAKKKEMLQRRDRLYRERAEAMEAMKNLVGSREHEELLLEKEVLVARLKRLSERWAELSIAKGLLDMARQRFEQENQPRVLAKASRHLKKITGDRYWRIIPDPDEGFVVISREGRRLGPARLSRGTAEQLYLCLRFGVISTCEPEGERIPVLMDDIFVNFDPGRMRLAARAAAELSMERQVLFFTCHPQVAELLKEEGHGVRIETMGGPEA